MKKGKENWIEENVRIEEIRIGMEFINHTTGRLSRVTGLTANSVEMFNKRDWSSRYNVGNEYGEDVGRVKGIDSKQWYGMDQFNRQFIKVDDIIKYKFDKLSEYMGKSIDSNKFASTYRTFDHFI